MIGIIKSYETARSLIGEQIENVPYFYHITLNNEYFIQNNICEVFGITGSIVDIDDSNFPHPFEPYFE